MSIINIVSYVFLIIGAFFAVLKDLHMLQQNSYYATRYIKWLNNAYKSYIPRLFWLIILVSSAIINDIVFCIASVIFSLVYIISARNSQKKAIKPLVFTARVIRMLVTATVINIGVAAVSLFILTQLKYLLLVLCCLTPLTALLVKLINEPIEALIRAYFIGDAKRILQNHKPMTIIGITGSYGKTSTKFALVRLLQEKFNVAYTPASFNTTMGVVRTIRENLKASDDIFVVEMGAKNVGDIKEICDIVKPNIAVITSVGPQHLETFKTIENVAKTKFELADAVQKNEGTVYLNFASEPVRNKANGYEFVSYAAKDSNCRILNAKSGRFGAEFALKYKSAELNLSTKLLGTHNIQNISGAVAVALDLGVTDRDVVFAVSKLAAVSHRLEMKAFINGSILIDDAYNSNPSGCLEAVNVLGSFDSYKKIIVTPGLVELGDKEYQFNYDLGAAASEVCDLIILVGEKRAVALADGVRSNSNFEQSNLHIVSTFKDAMKLLGKVADSNTVVLFENDLPDNYAG